MLGVQQLRLVGRTARGNTVTTTGMQPTAANGDAVDEVGMYRSSDGSVRLDIRTDGDTVWLTRQQIGDLFSRDAKTIGKHVANARREELAGESVVAKCVTTAADGKIYKIERYNLDMALSIGSRVKSPEDIQFRRWHMTSSNDRSLQASQRMRLGSAN